MYRDKLKEVRCIKKYIIFYIMYTNIILPGKRFSKVARAGGPVQYTPIGFRRRVDRIDASFHV